MAEFALLLPLLLVIVFGIIEFANAWRTSQVITNAAREGARRAILPDDPSADSIKSYVKNYITNAGLDGDLATVNVDCDTGGGFTSDGSTACDNSGDAERIDVDYPYSFTFLGPLIELATGSSDSGYGTITLDATTIMRNE